MNLDIGSYYLPFPPTVFVPAQFFFFFGLLKAVQVAIKNTTPIITL